MYAVTYLFCIFYHTMIEGNEQSSRKLVARIGILKSLSFVGVHPFFVKLPHIGQIDF